MGHVYLICDPSTDHFKIGVTRNKDSQRIKKLQTGNSTELFLRDIYETQWPFRLEKMLHNAYKSKKVLNEWFALDVNQVVNFKSTCARLENIIMELSDNPHFIKDLK